MVTSIARKNWVSRFSLTGRAIVGDNTFKIDKQNEKSTYVYNSMALYVDCGKEHGRIRTEMFGGYSLSNPYPIRKPSKNKENGSPNFNNQVVIEWADRLDPEAAADVHEMSMFTVGLKRTTEGKVYEKKFLTEYDAIAYISECLTSDMTVNVWGTLEYSLYEGNVSVRKKITGITLAKSDDPANYKANFTQSILIDKDSASLTADGIDKDNGVMFVNARVLEYAKEYNGHEVKTNFPYNVQFEQILPSDPKIHKAFYDFLYNVKKGVTQINMEGEFVESGATVKATLDDLTPDIKFLLECKLITEEEALARCSTNESGERRMILKTPVSKSGVISKFEEQYEEDDLVLECMLKGSVASDEGDDEIPFKEDGRTFDDEVMDMIGWLND